jgi:arabinan endo-1,5-alpha-L-arabinosidase
MTKSRRGTPATGARWRPWTLLPLVATLSLALAAPPTVAAAKDNARPVTTTYENPLAPVVPGDGTVDSCADPTVLQGQDGETIDGKQVWYLYCTTDPLNDDDVDANGDPVFHRIPTMVSTDLVNWTYVGDAFPSDGGELPDWIAPNAAFWAPEVVYSSATDQYYLFVTVTETTAAGGGSDTCGGDSAIGVAVGDSPTGPWTWSDEPVVAPRHDPGGGECSYFWTFDPEVLGDTVATDGILYYGSYYGGVFATDVTFSETGVTAETADTTDDTRIAIGNRYEGAEVVQRDGYYYLFASAANCCNGALTGYSVFVGRSTSPFGPFLDKEGNSFLEAAVGGTPFLTMNGNRWIGTGHNTVFVDEGGQWWTIYHAVDVTDPYFAGTNDFTKRPALLDQLDWVDGWPIVRGGSFGSDTPQQAPAAQPGDETNATLKLAPRDLVGTPIEGVSDEFDGVSLGAGWTWVRPPAPASYGVAGGSFSMDTQAADLFVDSNNASVLTRPAPDGNYVVETKVRLSVPAEGCCFNYVQAGLVIYGSDDAFVKLATVSIWNTRQSEFAKEVAVVPAGYPRYGNTVVGPPGEWTWLRIVAREDVTDSVGGAYGGSERYTAYTSHDGLTWTRGGTWTHQLGDDARVGLVAMGGSGFRADFAYVRTSHVHR